MTIIYKNWRITDRINDNKMLFYGYAVQEQVGEQWKRPAYVPTLAQAVNEMFERAARLELKNKIIDFKKTGTEDSLTLFAKKLDDIKEEILEACDV